MSSEEKDLFKSWWEMQENLFETWKNTFTSFQPQAEKESASALPYQGWQNWLKMQEQALENWKKMMSGFGSEGAADLFHPQKMMEMFRPDKYAEMMKSGQLYSPEAFSRLQQEWLQMASRSMQEFMKFIPTGVGQETLQKMMGSSGVYTELLNFWNRMAPQIPGSDEAAKWQQFSQEWMEEYTRVLESFFSTWLPEPLREMVKSPAELTQMAQQNFFTFFAPWLGAGEEMQQKIFKALEGDRDAYLELMKTWQNAYGESFGKVLKVPAVGLTRENMERFNASLDSYMQYATTMSEFSALMYRTGFEAMESLLQKYAARVEEGQAPTTFREFYQLWWQTNEETFMEVFRTESFARMLGGMVNAGARFKKRYDELLTEILTDSLPIPTNREMDGVYKTVQQLKRSQREQNRKLEDMEGKLSQLTEKLEQLEKEKTKGGASS